MVLLLATTALATPGDLRDAVVVVQQGSAACAGTLIDDEGTVLTAYHCVMSGGRPKVTMRDGRVAVGTVRGVDRRRDLAIVTTALTGPFLGVRAKSAIADEPVRVVGHPQAASPPGGFFTGLLRWSVSTGTVSAVGSRAIQTTAPINPGNSGGPVVGADDQVIGVVSRRMVGDGLGFAGRVDALPSRTGRMGFLGGALVVGTFLQVTGTPVAVGASAAVELRDRIVVEASAAVPLGLRWNAVDGPATHHPWSAVAGLRQRMGRGPLTVRLDALAGVGAVHTLATSDDGRLQRTMAWGPVVEGRVSARGMGFAYGAVWVDGVWSQRARVFAAWPGTLGLL